MDESRTLLVKVFHVLYPLTDEVLNQIFSRYGLVEMFANLDELWGPSNTIEEREKSSEISASISTAKSDLGVVFDRIKPTLEALAAACEEKEQESATTEKEQESATTNLDELQFQDPNPIDRHLEFPQKVPVKAVPAKLSSASVLEGCEDSVAGVRGLPKQVTTIEQVDIDFIGTSIYLESIAANTMCWFICTWKSNVVEIKKNDLVDLLVVVAIYDLNSLSKIKVNQGILKEKNYLVFIGFRPGICFYQSPAFVSAQFAKIHKLDNVSRMSFAPTRSLTRHNMTAFKHIVALFWLIMAVVKSIINGGFGKVFGSADPKKIIFYSLAHVLVVSCLVSPPYRRASQVPMHSSSFKIFNLFIIPSLCVLVSKSKSLYGKAIKDYGIAIAMSFDRVSFSCLGTYSVALYVFNLEGKMPPAGVRIEEGASGYARKISLEHKAAAIKVSDITCSDLHGASNNDYAIVSQVSKNERFDLSRAKEMIFYCLQGHKDYGV
ncbi:hypothetical protein CCACVL1_08117 [Corchorus capsularis]|uniref:Uncharacterized protein n=1 Tax=Corchorus capsularis TaxID=210143 RepID=A0A1R3J246_COCAP|nr:hypothetical protein CCACVL1_08117 [Corchorus capsularis]